MNRIINFLKRETIFCVSFFLAFLSSLMIRPDLAYLAYPDYRTLALLFCLMIIVAGFQSLGVFSFLGQSLLKKAKSLRKLSMIMVLLCFFCSMIITNDVTLITFVPFIILVFRMIKREDRILMIVILETIAANLGSMATPIGNPQNLYLYSAADITMKQFFQAVFPYAGLALAMLIAVLLIGRDEPLEKDVLKGQTKIKFDSLFPAMLPYLLLLGLCLLVVFRIFSYGPVFLCVTVVVFLVNWRLFRSVDYFLLLTFLCFFVFIGNIKRIPEISSLLVSLVQGKELWAGILVSQVISNVPAAILLSGFTRNFSTLLTAVNLGGLGTLIASLASLISFKFYAKEYPRRKGAFLKNFTLWNLAFLFILTGAAYILG